MNTNSLIVRSNGNLLGTVQCDKNWNGTVPIGANNVNQGNSSLETSAVTVHGDGHRKVYTKRSSLPRIAIKRKDYNSPYCNVKNEVGLKKSHFSYGFPFAKWWNFDKMVVVFKKY